MSRGANKTGGSDDISVSPYAGALRQRTDRRRRRRTAGTAADVRLSHSDRHDRLLCLADRGFRYRPDRRGPALLAPIVANDAAPDRAVGGGHRARDRRRGCPLGALCRSLWAQAGAHGRHGVVHDHHRADRARRRHRLPDRTALCRGDRHGHDVSDSLRDGQRVRLDASPRPFYRHHGFVSVARLFCIAGSRRRDHS